MDKRALMVGLLFHPHRDRKIGMGIQEVKVHYVYIYIWYIIC